MRSLACGPPLGVASGACPWRGGWSGPLEGACLVCGRMWACLPPLPSGLGVQTAGYDTCTPQIPRQARMVPVQLHAYIIMGSKGMGMRGLGKPMPRMDSAGHAWRQAAQRRGQAGPHHGRPCRAWAQLGRGRRRTLAQNRRLAAQGFRPSPWTAAQGSFRPATGQGTNGVDLLCHALAPCAWPGSLPCNGLQTYGFSCMPSIGGSAGTTM